MWLRGRRSSLRAVNLELGSEYSLDGQEAPDNPGEFPLHETTCAAAHHLVLSRLRVQEDTRPSVAQMTDAAWNLMLQLTGERLVDDTVQEGAGAARAAEVLCSAVLEAAPVSGSRTSWPVPPIAPIAALAAAPAPEAP